VHDFIARRCFLGESGSLASWDDQTSDCYGKSSDVEFVQGNKSKLSPVLSQATSEYTVQTPYK